MDESTTTIKVKLSSRKALRLLSALSDKTMLQTLDDILQDALVKEMASEPAE